MPKSTKKYFLDANILLEVIFDRKHAESCKEFMRSHPNSGISALTAHLVVHFGAMDFELDVLRSFLADFNTTDLTKQDFDWAFSNSLGDFEDALQLGLPSVRL